jgi:DNA polymerase I
MCLLDHFHEIVACDFEFNGGPGERSHPVCAVAWELRSGRKWRIWEDQFGTKPPFPTGRDSVFVSYLASAELGCFRSLGWPMPERILDLFAEFRNLTNGCQTVAGNSLLGALAHFGLDGIDATEKEQMRRRILAGAPWLPGEPEAVLDYCQSDVTALNRLLPAMAPPLDLPRALLRGRYMSAVAAMEQTGVPINTGRLGQLIGAWNEIRDRLIARIDPDYRVYEGQTFKLERFERYLERNRIPWPRLPSGQLDLEDRTFKEMSKIYPVIAPLRELRYTLSQLKLWRLTVGSDGRNRCLLSPFSSRSSRNQPSSAKFIFGPSVWLRNLIEPPPGHGLAYLDYEQQEFAVAAALSRDPNMLAAYESGDCYLAFAKQAGVVPVDGTKLSHPVERELFKLCVLAVQYGMEARSLAVRIGRPEFEARRLLQHHREIYRRFWQWISNLVDHAVLSGYQQTVFGWTNWIPATGRALVKKRDGDSRGNGLRDGESFNPRSLRNFPMQATSAEILRLAICLGVERGVEVCAPVHDAVLICAPLDRLEADVERMLQCMAEASRVVLNGFEIRTEAKPVRSPDHYSDPRGERMWQEILSLLPTTTYE